MKIPIALLTLAAVPCFGLAADITGTWKAEFDSQIGFQKYTFTLEQDGTNLTGKANSEVNDRKREAELKEAKVDGDKVSFVEMLSLQGNDIPIRSTGTISTNELKLSREVGDFAKSEIVARRASAASNEPSAAVPGARR